MPADGTNLNVREEALAKDDIFQLSANCLNHLYKSLNIHVNDGWTEWMGWGEWISGWGEAYFGCEISVEELLLVPQVVQVLYKDRQLQQLGHLQKLGMGIKPSDVRKKPDQDLRDAKIDEKKG